MCAIVIECDSFPGTKPAAGIASGASFGDSDFSFHGASPFFCSGYNISGKIKKKMICIVEKLMYIVKKEMNYHENSFS